MPRDRLTEQVRVTLAELSFQGEAASLVLERAALELPDRLSGEVCEVIKLLRRQATTLRSMAERVQEGDIAVLQ